MSGVIRITEALIPLVDKAIEQTTDEYGTKKYDNRRDVVDDAVKRLMKELGIKPLEAE